jgi:uncharacterized membrane protein YraQ (UPF0718 family)
MPLFNLLWQALAMAFSMFWEILWPLVLGFALSAVVQALVARETLARALGGVGPRQLLLATLLGAASSSCSYAAVALARSLFRKGASFAAAMVFELASTNLVIELGAVSLVLLGWQFPLAEYLGGLLMIASLALLFRFTLSPRLLEEARAQAERGLSGRMEGHAAMALEMGGASFWRRLFSARGFTVISHFFVMDWVAVWTDIALGLLIAGALAAWVPPAFWRAFFLTDNPTLAAIEGPLLGPLVAVLSFVCSVGNVPLAAVLWRGGISFGGAISFIFADLIVLPILDIYRKYYGWRMSGYLLLTFYLSMALAGYLVELLFAVLGITPQGRTVGALAEGISWNYTTVLNILALVLVGCLVVRFMSSGGPAMLKMMNRPAEVTASAPGEQGRSDPSSHHHH